MTPIRVDTRHGIAPLTGYFPGNPQNNQFTPHITGGSTCDGAGSYSSSPQWGYPLDPGAVSTPHPGRVRLCGSHAPRQGASRVVNPRQPPGKQVASDKAWHLQGTPLVAVPGVGASLRGLRAGRVMRLAAGVRHGFSAPQCLGASAIAFVDIEMLQKGRIYIKKAISVWIKYTGGLDFKKQKRVFTSW